MSQLEAAQEHLAKALKRLEDALTRRLSAPPPGSDADYERAFAQIVAERDELARECDRLNAALSEMQREHDRLREVTGQVSRRLDGSIAEIDRLLEG